MTWPNLLVWLLDKEIYLTVLVGDIARYVAPSFINLIGHAIVSYSLISISVSWGHANPKVPPKVVQGLAYLAYGPSTEMVLARLVRLGKTTICFDFRVVAIPRWVLERAPPTNDGQVLQDSAESHWWIRREGSMEYPHQLRRLDHTGGGGIDKCEFEIGSFIFK